MSVKGRLILGALLFFACALHAHAAPDAPSIARAVGRELRVQKRLANNALDIERVYTIRGVCYEPTEPGGARETAAEHYYGKTNVDLPLIKAMNANTIKIYVDMYSDYRGTGFLDACYENGIMVIVSLLMAYDDMHYLSIVNYFKNHPAILAWCVGNEINFNNLYSTNSLDACVARVATAVREIQAADPNHPVSVCWGDISANNFPLYYAKLSHADMFSFNMYRGLSFFNAFEVWKALSGKPMFISEYGADAYDGRAGYNREHQEAQSDAAKHLTEEIIDNLVWLDARNVCSGGTIFNFSDEWWKAGSADVQDTFSSLSSTLHPDNMFHEDWWGLVDIARTPRLAYTTMKDMYSNLMRREALVVHVDADYANAKGREARLRSPYDVMNASLKATNASGDVLLIALTQTSSGEYTGMVPVTEDTRNGEWRIVGEGVVNGETFTPSVPLSVDTVPPSAPRNFKAVKGGKSIQVSWDNSEDALSGIKGYVLKREGESPLVKETVECAYSDSIKGLEGSVFEYTLIAVDNAGNESAVVRAQAVTDIKAVFSTRIVSETMPVIISANVQKGTICKGDVYDSKGNNVARFTERTAEKDGVEAFVWNGEDDKGRSLPIGLYYIAIKIGNQKTQKEKVFIQ